MRVHIIFSFLYWLLAALVYDYIENASIIEFTLQTRALLIYRWIYGENVGERERECGRNERSNENSNSHHRQTHHYKSQFSAFLNKMQSCKHVFISIRLFCLFFIVYIEMVYANNLQQEDLSVMIEKKKNYHVKVWEKFNSYDSWIHENGKY